MTKQTRKAKKYKPFCTRNFAEGPRGVHDILYTDINAAAAAATTIYYFRFQFLFNQPSFPELLPVHAISQGLLPHGFLQIGCLPVTQPTA